MEAIPRLTLRWLGAQTTYFAISQIDTMDFALLTFRIKSVAISRIEKDVKTVTTGQCSPVAVANPFLAWDSARPNPVLVILEAACNSEIRFRVVERNPIIFS